MEIHDGWDQVKIWQRVRQPQLPVTETLQSVVASVLLNATVYSGLMRQLQGEQRELVMQLRRMQTETARCLKGIYRMATGSAMQVSAGSCTVETLEGALRANFGRSLKALEYFENCCSDREYGAVFAGLAQSERQHCRKLAEAMGIM